MFIMEKITELQVSIVFFKKWVMPKSDNYDH